MAWSVGRRLFYLGLVVLFFAAIGAIIYSGTRAAPSCSDNKQNQSELDIDCGGPCARVCPFEVKPLTTVWSRIFNLENGRYDVATFLKNPNRVHATRQLQYRVRLFDRSGILVTTREAEAFVNPGESLFLYNTRLDVGNRTPERVVFEITGGPVWQRVERTPVPLKAKFKSFTNTPSPLLVANLENSSLTDLSDVQVVAVLSDEEENALAISSTLVEKLAKGEEREISFTWPKSLPVEPTFFDFYPHYDLAKVK